MDNHQAELDIVRIISALFIVFYHYTYRGYAADGYSPINYQFLGLVFKYGFLGIYMFFILSGYTVVSSIKTKTASTFLFKRFIRLYPTFWISVLLTTIFTMCCKVETFDVEWMQFFTNLTMLQNYFGISPIDGVYWFLEILLRFYTIIALIKYLGLIKYYHYIAGLWLSIGILIIQYDLPKLGIIVIPKYSPFLILGMMYYSIRENGLNVYRGSVILTAYGLSMILLKEEISKVSVYHNTDFSIGIVYVSFVLMNVFMAYICLKRRSIHLPYMVTVLSSATYPLYLVHQNIGYIIFHLTFGILNKYVILSLTFLLMVLISICICQYVNPLFVRKMKEIYLYIQKIHYFNV